MPPDGRFIVDDYQWSFHSGISCFSASISQLECFRLMKRPYFFLTTPVLYSDISTVETVVSCNLLSAQVIYKKMERLCRRQKLRESLKRLKVNLCRKYPNFGISVPKS